MTRFSAEDWEERQFGREGFKAGDVISLLIHAERGPSRRTLTGLVHNVVHKPKPKNAVYPKFNMIRELWVWVSSSAAVHDVSDIKYIHQCISLQCSEKVNVALSWGFSFVACPNSACSIMGVKDVAIASKTLHMMSGRWVTERLSIGALEIHKRCNHYYESVGRLSSAPS